MKNFLLLSVGLLLAVNYAQADSPLTSTPFHQAYADLPIVQQALEANGRITEAMMAYLSNKRNPVAAKMAVVNAIGWTNAAMPSNDELYLQYLEQKYRRNRAHPKFYRKLHGDELLALAYLQALDHYSDRDQLRAAAQMADRALARKKKYQRSYTFQLIAALIKAQVAFFGDGWCEVYQITDRVRQNARLRQELKPEAVDIVFGYMDLYQSECK